VPDITDILPLAVETPESILARFQADVNAGIDPADPLYADILPGSVWDDVARAEALELDRVYDRMLTEVPAAALPALATGLWIDAWADTVGLERTGAVPAGGTVRFTGPDTTPIPAGTQVSTEAPTATADPVTFQTTESAVIAGTFVDVPMQAVDEGSAGNVAANSITLLDSSIDGVTVSNTTPMTGGADVEADEHLQGRVLKKLRGTNGAGNVDYYENLALNYPGVGFVTVQPNTPALGDVRIVIRDVNGDPEPSFVIEGLQELLDPSGSSAQGAGEATIGAAVTVTTPTAHIIAVTAAITPETGYSVTGTGGTKALHDSIVTALGRYIEGLDVGADVVRNKVLAAIVDVEGVADANLTVPATDVVVSSTEVAVLGTVTLT
jgi:uncharacterized phage protein gp47/JayE